jgi:RNA polymerase sigma factor (sigma-70 family)
MRRIQSENLAQLLNQLRFTPVKKRRKQLAEAEKLLKIVQQDKEYPFEFVSFKITGFPPKSTGISEIIKGAQLAEDLRIFIGKLSNQIAEPAGIQKEKIYSIEELAGKFGITTKTINRWRHKGLSTRRYIFNDGQKRFGFSESVVERFIQTQPELAKKSGDFQRMSTEEKRKIIKMAAELAGKTELSRHQIIQQISEKTGRSHETIRYTLINYDKANPEKPIFGEEKGAIDSERQSEIYRLYKQGVEIEELIKRFRRSKSSIYRIINRRRAKILAALKVEYIMSDEFLEEDADKKILSTQISPKKEEYAELKGSSLVEYLRALRNVRLLNRQQEFELFRRYNFLKYLAAKQRNAIIKPDVTGSELKKTEQYLAGAEKIKRMIIESNLLLVVNIARKHTQEPSLLMELISEGNVSLMKAVEKFDYTKGFRFSTFGSWVITKDFARKIPAEVEMRQKSETLQDVERDRRITAGTDFAAIERARASLVEVIRNELDEREQYIILNHFGLIGTGVKKSKKTLGQIGEDLQLSKERVRQLELAAIQKLRQTLSVEQFELLTE